MEIGVRDEMQDPVHDSSPCARCPKDRPGKACSAYVPELDQFVCGCAKWYSWALDCWRSIHQQGLEAIEAKRLAEGEEERRRWEQMQKKEQQRRRECRNETNCR